MYKRESGAAGRKRRKEEEERESALLENVPNLQRFFGPAPSVSSTSVPNTSEVMVSDASVAQDVSESTNGESIGLDVAGDLRAIEEIQERPEQQDVAEILQNPAGIADISIGPEFDNDSALWLDLLTESLRTFLDC